MPPTKVNEEDKRDRMLDRILKQLEDNGKGLKANYVALKAIRVGLKELLTTVTELKVGVAEIRSNSTAKKNGALEMKAETREQVLRMNDVIQSGLKPPKRMLWSNAKLRANAKKLTVRAEQHRLASGELVAEAKRMKNGNEAETREQVLRMNDVILSGIKHPKMKAETRACYTLSRKANTEKPAVLLKFVNRRARKKTEGFGCLL